MFIYTYIHIYIYKHISIVLNSWGAFSSSGKHKLQFVSGRQKAADYVKILNDLSLAQEGRHLCGEE